MKNKSLCSEEMGTVDKPAKPEEIKNLFSAWRRKRCTEVKRGAGIKTKNQTRKHFVGFADFYLQNCTVPNGVLLSVSCSSWTQQLSTISKYYCLR